MCVYTYIKIKWTTTTTTTTATRTCLSKQLKHELKLCLRTNSERKR